MSHVEGEFISEIRPLTDSLTSIYGDAFIGASASMDSDKIVLGFHFEKFEISLDFDRMDSRPFSLDHLSAIVTKVVHEFFQGDKIG